MKTPDVQSPSRLLPLEATGGIGIPFVSLARSPRISGTVFNIMGNTVFIHAPGSTETKTDPFCGVVGVFDINHGAYNMSRTSGFRQAELSIRS